MQTITGGVFHAARYVDVHVGVLAVEHRQMRPLDEVDEMFRA